MPHLPMSDAVVVALIKTFPGTPPLGVATSLPGDAGSWADLGFIQVASVGGSPLTHVPVRVPVLQVDCWASNVNSQKPAWSKAGNLAEVVVNATYDFEPLRVTLPETFYPARVLSCWPVTEPRRIPGDPSGFARVTFDLAVKWAVIK